jgi:hypothetical protein
MVSPGVIRVRTRDYARAERTYERQQRHHQAEVDMRAAILADGGDVPEPLPIRGTIYAWSRKSRARLVARLSDLDYTRLYGRYRTCADCGAEHSDQLDRCPACRSPHAGVVDRTGRLPAMLTLTYPGDWLRVARDAETVKRHFWALCKRYERTWGEPLIGPWKLEFQRRGAGSPCPSAPRPTVTCAAGTGPRDSPSRSPSSASSSPPAASTPSDHGCGKDCSRTAGALPASNAGPAFASQLARHLLHHVPESGLPRGAGSSRLGGAAARHPEAAAGVQGQSPWPPEAGRAPRMAHEPAP